MIIDMINKLPTEIARHMFMDLYMEADTLEEEMTVLSQIDEFYERRAEALRDINDVKVNVSKDGWVTVVA